MVVKTLSYRQELFNQCVKIYGKNSLFEHGDDIFNLYLVLLGKRDALLLDDVITSHRSSESKFAEYLNEKQIALDKTFATKTVEERHSIIETYTAKKQIYENIDQCFNITKLVSLVRKYNGEISNIIDASNAHIVIMSPQFQNWELLYNIIANDTNDFLLADLLGYPRVENFSSSKEGASIVCNFRDTKSTETKSVEIFACKVNSWKDVDLRTRAIEYKRSLIDITYSCDRRLWKLETIDINKVLWNIGKKTFKRRKSVILLEKL
jgi:hypothetical protein